MMSKSNLEIDFGICRFPSSLIRFVIIENIRTILPKTDKHFIFLAQRIPMFMAVTFLSKAPKSSILF